MKYYLEKEDWIDIVQKEYIENNKTAKEVSEKLGITTRQFDRYKENKGIVKRIRSSKKWRLESKTKTDKGLKQCRICNEWKRKEGFYRKLDGRGSICKKCSRKVQGSIKVQHKKLIKLLKLRQYLLSNVSVSLEQLKYCSICGNWLKREEFGIDESYIGGLKSTCKMCRNKRIRKRYNNLSHEEKKKFRNKTNSYVKNRLENDPVLKVKYMLRSSFRYYMKREEKQEYWEEILEYTYEDLRKHIESKFQDGMSWENYGLYGWHLDHIQPISSFNFKGKNNIEEIRRCWGLHNLQPLWAKDNLSKGAKLNWIKCTV